MQKLFLLAGLCVIAAGLGSPKSLVALFDSGKALQASQFINAQLPTHLIYSFVTINSSGICDIDSHKQKFKAFNSLKTSNPQLKTLLEARLSSSNVGEAVITSIVNTVQQNNFDGLNIYWTSKTDSSFSQLIQELKGAFKNPASSKILLLTASVSADSAVIAASSQVANIANDVDFLNVLTAELDIKPSNPSFPDTISALQSWADKGAPNNKLNLGIPALGETDASSINYKLCDQKPSDWFSYDNKDTIIAKVAYIKEKNFGGAYVMPIKLDNVNGIDCSMGTNSNIQLLRDQLDKQP